MFRTIFLSIFFLAYPVLLFKPDSLGALEERTTTARLIKSAPYVAHVRVENIRRVPGPVPIFNYQVLLLESLKGDLPQAFDVRVMLGSGVLQPSSRPTPPGSEWILILGRKNKFGVYPLRSLTWGKIELFQNQETGDYYLARPVNGFPGQSGPRLSLQEFRLRVREILGHGGKDNE